MRGKVGNKNIEAARAITGNEQSTRLNLEKDKSGDL